MIFLSHNHKDKPFVEPIALRLSEIFGQEAVFYDSWAIQPGDGIITRMSAGLESTKFVFFFASANSLQSNMVSLEWQNALYRTTKGKCRLISVRADQSDLPSVLSQSAYIDLYANGIEACIMQMVSIVQGQSTFTPRYEKFSNLTFRITGISSASLKIVIAASHFVEPSTGFLFFFQQREDEIAVLPQHSGMSECNFYANIALTNGDIGHGHFVKVLGIPLSPGFPIEFLVTSKKVGSTPQIKSVLHQIGQNAFVGIPDVSLVI